MPLNPDMLDFLLTAVGIALLALSIERIQQA